MAVKAIPEGYHTVTPSLTASHAAGLIDFMKAAFGAQELMRMPTPDGKIAHAEVKIGDSIIMLDDPMQFSAAPASLFLYVRDVDATYRSALKAGATSVQEPANQFWGDRMAQVKDGCGNRWMIATHVEDVPPNEMAKRMEAAMKG